jgi:hypothetical protein
MASILQRRSSWFLVFSSVNRLAKMASEFVKFHGCGASRSDHDVCRVRPEGHAHHRLTDTPLRTIPSHGITNAARGNDPNLGWAGGGWGMNHDDPSRTTRGTGPEDR